MKAYVFIGRFQPLHEGHISLIKAILREGSRVLVALRRTEKSPSDPYSMDERLRMFRQTFKTEIEVGSVILMPLPVDIAGVVYGRDVGYEIRRIYLDSETEAISATAIRGHTVNQA